MKAFGYPQLQVGANEINGGAQAQKLFCLFKGPGPLQVRVK